MIKSTRIQALFSKLAKKAPLCPWRSTLRLFEPKSRNGRLPPIDIKQILAEDRFHLLRFAGKHDFWFPKSVNPVVTVWNEYLAATWEHPSNSHYYLRHVDGFGPADTILDCGACEGFFTRYALDHGAGCVICIEPSSAMCACLNRTFKDEILDGRVRILPVALSSLVGQARFAMEIDDPFSGRVGGQDGELITLTTIDELSSQHGPPTFIKMDLEGSEYEALRGGLGLLSAKKPRLAVTTYHNTWDFRVVDSLLRGLGYRDIWVSSASLRGTEIPRPMMIHAS